MQGWLIVNSFVKTDKFKRIYSLLSEQAEVHGISLSVRTTDSLICSVSSGFSELSLPDFAIFWDKDVLLAKRLEAAGLRLFNSASAIETCDSKALTGIVMAQNNIKTPLTFFSPKTYEGTGYTNLNFLEEVEKTLSYPMILKEEYGSFGQQVYLAHDGEEARDLIATFGAKQFLLQEFIEESCGKDIRVNVVGGRCVAAMFRYNSSDFRSNITSGGMMLSYDISKEQEVLALSACRAIGLDFAGVDILFGKDGPILCEVNSNPHFKSTLECTGVNMASFIMEYIGESLS